ncbi:MAG: hypothetical protein JNL83_33990 [Myxococcales bacterium]|nr:hypothetical protein [Myxococcales bacterium]
MGPEEARARDALLDMQERLSRDPYAALGLIPSATPADIRNAFLARTKQFHPARFARMSPDIQRLANEVFLQLRAAHDTLARPTTVPRTLTPGPLKPPPPGMPRPSGTGANPTVRPATGSTPLASSSSSMPAAGGPRPPTSPTSPYAAPRPGSSSAAPARPGSSPGQPYGGGPTQPYRGQPTDSSATQPLRTQSDDHAVTQPLRTGAHATTQPIRTDGRTPAPQVTRPGTIPGAPARPAGVPSSPPPTAGVPRRPGSSPSAPSGPLPTLGGAARPAQPVDRELAPILELIAQQQLAAARVALETLCTRQPQNTKYRALLCFTRGREAQLAQRIDEARVELQDALQLDPDLQLAKTALGELFTRRR